MFQAELDHRTEIAPAAAQGADEPLRLHIGGEIAKPGWKILNIQPDPNVDFVGDCTDLSRFSADSVSEVYAAHVYEHLSYAGELVKAFAAVHRVLKPRGLFKVSVPDLEMLCGVFVRPDVTADQRFYVMRVMFGGQTDPYDFHKVGLTREFLASFLQQAGFRTVRRVSQFGLFEDCSTLKLAGQYLSLNVEAVK